MVIQDDIEDIEQRIAMMKELLAQVPLPPFIELALGEAESAGKKVIRLIAAVPAELLPLPPQLFQQCESQVRSDTHIFVMCFLSGRGLSCHAFQTACDVRPYLSERTYVSIHNRPVTRA